MVVVMVVGVAVGVVVLVAFPSCVWPSSSLSLQNNALEGDIPGEIQFLTRLTALNLARNRLTGTLPPTLSVLGTVL